MVPAVDNRSAEATPPANRESSIIPGMTLEEGEQGGPPVVGGPSTNDIGREEEEVQATAPADGELDTNSGIESSMEGVLATDTNNGVGPLVEEGVQVTPPEDGGLDADNGIAPWAEEGDQAAPPVDGGPGTSNGGAASAEKGVETTSPTDWAVNIDSETGELIQNPGKEVTSWSKLSIYRVPMHMCDATDKTEFRPQVVSLGPYHRGTRPLSLMEAAKRRALIHLLRETNRSVKYYLDALRDSLETIMEAYEQLDENWREDEEKFLEMMVLDGCFVIEILRGNFSIYAVSDPVFSEFRQPTVIEYIRRDMLLLENQLPLLVIEKLAAVVAAATGSESDILSLLLKFCFPEQKFIHKDGGMHVLDVARQGMLHNEAADAQGPTDSGQSGKCATKLQQIWHGTKNSMKIWLKWLASHLRQAMMNAKCKEVIQSSATELHQAWIRFKQITKTSCYAPVQTKDDSQRSINQSRSVMELCQVGIDFQRTKSNRLIDITFSDDNLQIPPITIDHNSESMFLNFIAFEQLHLGKDRYVSSYFLFLGSLITSGEDVRLLRDNEIIESSTASDMAIETTIKRLIKGLSMSKEDRFCQIRKQLNDHYRKSQTRCKRKAKNWWTNLCETHFASPWTIIKLFAAIAFLGLTVVSTVYTVLQLYKGNH